MHTTTGLRLALATLLLALAGCQSPPADRPLTSDVPEPPGFAPPPEACQAAAARFGIGLRVSPMLVEEMRHRAGARMARTVLPADAPGAEQDATRLNIQVEPGGRVAGAYCG